MNKEKFEILLKESLLEMKIDISNKQVEQMYKYMEILLEWNEKMNLTAITELEDVVNKHLVDSLTINDVISDSESIVDMGTGAGFPGIPLAIMNTNKSFILVDSLNKRIKFLNHVIEELKLVNVSTLHSRAEDFANKEENIEKYDVIVFRAVSKISALLEYGVSVIKINGKCICMKSSTYEEELEKAKNAMKLLDVALEKINSIAIPKTDIVRKNIVFRKQKATNINYPRKAVNISKNPL